MIYKVINIILKKKDKSYKKTHLIYENLSVF